MNISKMKPIVAFAAIFTAISSTPVQAEQVGPITINYIYQLGDQASFDLDMPERPNDCGSSLYRVRNDNAAVLERKFSIAMGALLANKKIVFNEEDVCEGNRMTIGWIRVLK